MSTIDSRRQNGEVWRRLRAGYYAKTPPPNSCAREPPADITVRGRHAQEKQRNSPYLVDKVGINRVVAWHTCINPTICLLHLRRKPVKTLEIMEEQLMRFLNFACEDPSRDIAYMKCHWRICACRQLPGPLVSEVHNLRWHQRPSRAVTALSDSRWVPLSSCLHVLCQSEINRFTSDQYECRKVKRILKPPDCKPFNS